MSARPGHDATNVRRLAVCCAEELVQIAHYSRRHEDVTRKGESQPCDLPAVAIRLREENTTLRAQPATARGTREHG